MKYPLANSTWDEREKVAIMRVIGNGRMTMGPKVKEFEDAYAKYFDSKYAVMVNSGSSANLLAIGALMYSSKYDLLPGDEVIVPAVSWSTTYFPIHQYGLKLSFVDIDKDTLNMNLENIKDSITEQTKAIFAVNLLGNSNDFDQLKQICDEHDLILIEDNCESLGAKFNDQFTGTFGACGTFSFFFSHHMQTMEGGMILTDDEELYHILLSLRAHGWLRELPDVNHVHNKTGNAFEDSFTFVTPGYSVRPLEMSGAIGLIQLNKLAGFIEGRRKNAKIFQDLFSNLECCRIQSEISESSWFGFSIVLEDTLKNRRREVINILSENGVESRPIVGGNFVKNPVINHLDYVIHGTLENAEYIDKNGFFIGNEHTDLSENLEEVKQIIMGLA